MAIIPVLHERGIYVESSYEIEFTETLINKNILFIKPPKSNNVFKQVFNKYIPNFLLLERSSRDIVTIAEVFGFNDDEYWEDYWIQTNRKKRFYQSLSNFNFVSWNAFEGYEIPSIYNPKKGGKCISDIVARHR